MSDGDLWTISAVIVTLNRPECVRRCLAALQESKPAVHQIVVVDGSRDDLTRDVAEAFPGVLFLKNTKGLGHTTLSRNMSLLHVTGSIIAFIDDDAYVRAGWTQAMIDAFAVDTAIGAVAGRALNGQLNEDIEGVDCVGQITSYGEVLGFFAANTGRIVDVDHAIGCNMAFRRDVLAQCGGFRDGFDGRYCFREETDIFLVMKQLGYRIVFTPYAIVDHVPGPKPKGKRFDVVYAYYNQRNHCILLIRNFGVADGRVLTYIGRACIRIALELLTKIGGAFLRFANASAGMVVGIILGLKWRCLQGKNRNRRDAIGTSITEALERI